MSLYHLFQTLNIAYLISILLQQNRETIANSKSKTIQNVRNKQGKTLKACDWCGKLQVTCISLSHADKCKYNVNIPHPLTSLEVEIAIKCLTCEHIFDHLYYYKQHFVDGQNCGLFDLITSRPVIIYKCIKCTKSFARKDLAIYHYRYDALCERNKLESDDKIANDNSSRGADDTHENEGKDDETSERELVDKCKQIEQENSDLRRKLHELQNELANLKLKALAVAGTTTEKNDASGTDKIISGKRSSFNNTHISAAFIVLKIK